MTEPLDLAPIKARLASGPVRPWQARQDVKALIAEVERLRKKARQARSAVRRAAFSIADD